MNGFVEGALFSLFFLIMLVLSDRIEVLKIRMSNMEEKLKRLEKNE